MRVIADEGVQDMDSVEMEAPPNSPHPATFAPAVSRPVQRTVLEQYLGQLKVIHHSVRARLCARLIWFEMRAYAQLKSKSWK